MLPPNPEPRLFLVAPEPMQRECAHILSAHDFDAPLVFADLCAALDATLHQTPDLLLIEASVWEKQREISFHLRALQLEAHLPIVLLASADWKAANWSGLLEQDIECLSMPLREEELVPRVRSLLRTRQLSASLPRTADELDDEAEKEAAIARLEAIVTHLQSGILVVDQNRRVVLTNPEFCRIFGIEDEPENLIGQESWRVAAQTKYLLSPENSPAIWDRIEEIVSQRERVTGEEIALSDGRTLSRDCAPIFCQGRYLGHVWSYRDISERTNFERESLRKRDSALQSAKFQAEFLANMSHEIRTPINGVLGMLGLLADTALGADQRGLLQTAQTSADALLHIINDILDFSKVKAGKLHIEDGVYTPVAVLDDCLQTVISTAHDKGLELLSVVEPDVPNGVRGDGARVRQVLTNLLSNAIKFTHRGEIEVTIERSDSIGTARGTSNKEATQSQFLRYRVRDSGIGMSADSQQNLFQPFTQADGSTTRRYGGTGLGLAICKQLVERMGGQIGVESGSGQGSTFWFTLPLVPVEIADERDERELIVALCDARVLVVEDNATIRRFLLQQLGSWHISSDGSRTGSEAMHRLRSAARAGRAYDVALLDAQLPDTDAVSLAHEIKNDGLLARTDLLLMTAIHAALPDKSAFAGTVSKPVRQSQLHDALLQLFGGEPLERATDAQLPQREERDFGGARILLADDNAINREVALRWLQKWNCQTISVADGREAVEALERQEFDLVFMDCQMPELDGYEATRAIRSGNGAAKDVPIIAVTAHAMQGDRERCLDAGMTDYLSKPIRPDGLAEMIERWTKIVPRVVVPSVVPLPQSKPAPEIEVPVLPPILDEQTLRELHEAVGDEEFPQFVEMFYEQSSESERLLREAALQNDCDALVRLAHSLKGVSRQYGALDVATACEELELAAKNGDCSNGAANFAAQIDAIRRVLLAARIALHRTASTILAGEAPSS